MLAAGAGCDDPPFDPFPATDPIYSVFGFLDASSDTQWVRVAAVRERLATWQSPIDAIVTLERAPSGAPAILRDSVFSFPSGLPGADTPLVHNFWTTEPIEPGTTYRFRVSRSDGAVAEALVAIPEMFPITIVHHPTVTPVATLRLEGIEHLAMVHVRLMAAGRPCYSSIYPIPGAVNGVHTLQVSRTFPPEAGLLCDINGDVELFVVSSGAPWPGGAQFELEALDVPSEIERGVGFLGGVLSRSVPWEACLMDRPGLACELTYGPQSATLVASVTSSPCVEPAYGAEVRLTEIPERAVAARRIRTSVVRPGTKARIAALEGGRRYRLDITHPDPSYTAVTDTIEFEAGQVTVRDFTLQRSSPC